MDVLNNYERRITEAGLKKRPSAMLRLMAEYIAYCRRHNIVTDKVVMYRNVLQKTDNFRFLAKNFNNKYEPIATIDFYHACLFTDEVQVEPNIHDYDTAREFILACEQKVKSLLPKDFNPDDTHEEFYF